MNPLQVAKAHCANFDHGKCTGAYHLADLSIRACRSLPVCLLSGPIQRCPYFEDVVMRVTVDQSSSAGVRRKADFDEGIRQYRLATGLLKSENDRSRPCPDCRQRSLEAGKKFCYVCREKRRKETLKSSNRRRGRSRSVMTTTVQLK